MPLHYMPLHYMPLHCIPLSDMPMYYIPLHYIPFRYIQMHWIPLHSIPFFYTTLHYIHTNTHLHTHTHTHFHIHIYTYTHTHTHNAHNLIHTANISRHCKCHSCLCACFDSIMSITQSDHVTTQQTCGELKTWLARKKIRNSEHNMRNDKVVLPDSHMLKLLC